MKSPSQQNPDIDSAFPCEPRNQKHNGGETGMSLRDYFAAKALGGLIADSSVSAEKAANLAYIYADAMLKEREK